MASWFQKLTPKLFAEVEEKASIPAGVWSKCPKCNETIYSEDLEKLLRVCPSCHFHMPLSAKIRIETLFDENSFEEFDAQMKPGDPLNFNDKKRYKDRTRSLRKQEIYEAIRTGKAKIKNFPLIVGVFDFQFMGGSMGSVVGEKILRAAEKAIEQRLPLLIVSSSGGARMQESTISLMQMAKTSAAIKRLKKHRLPFISLLTQPTMGGVSASFAMLGDLIIAEPNASIGFAGPKVIHETIKQDLPEGFQTSEFLLRHGSIDRVIHRAKLREELHSMLEYTGNFTSFVSR